MEIEARLEAVRERVRLAAERGGYPADRVRIVGVGKTFPASLLRQVVSAGLRRLGENRVQEAEAKARELSGEVEWHLVGHLQSNKARRAARLFDWIHSVDSIRLAKRLSDAAREAARQLDILIQVDLAGEKTKFGLGPDDLRPALEAVHAMPGLRLRGLMTLPPQIPTAEQARPFFRRLRELGDEARGQGLLAERFDLSMGMSGDYEVAVEEGATLVRVGSAIFGPRPPVIR